MASFEQLRSQIKDILKNKSIAFVDILDKTSDEKIKEKVLIYKPLIDSCIHYQQSKVLVKQMSGFDLSSYLTDQEGERLFALLKNFVNSL